MRRPVRFLLGSPDRMSGPSDLAREEIKMRTSQPKTRHLTTTFAAGLFICGLLSPALAQAITTKEAAADRARAEGYVLVSKTEEAPGVWDVWASRDGIAYEVKIDARDGALIKAIPVEDND